MQPGLDDALKRLVSKTRFTKRARFNAQMRYSAKNSASILALTVVSVLALAISMYSSQAEEPIRLFNGAIPLDLIGNFLSLLALSFGFVVALGNYQDKALRLQQCALDLTRLLDRIENARQLQIAVADDLSTWTTAYHDIMEQCPYNHADVDSERASFNDETPTMQRVWNQIWYLWGVWGIHVLPFLIFLCFTIAAI